MKKLKLCNIFEETVEDDDLYRKFIVVKKKKKDELPPPKNIKFKEILKEEDDFFLDTY